MISCILLLLQEHFSASIALSHAQIETMQQEMTLKEEKYQQASVQVADLQLQLKMEMEKMQQQRYAKDSVATQKRKVSAHIYCYVTRMMRKALVLKFYYCEMLCRDKNLHKRGSLARLLTLKFSKKTIRNPMTSRFRNLKCPW